MKSLILTAVAALLCGGTALNAQDVAKVTSVGLNDPAKTLEFLPVNNPMTSLGGGKRAKGPAVAEHWFKVDVPVKITGTSTEPDATTAYLTEVDLCVHLLVRSGSGKYYRLSKVVSLADVPLRKDGSATRGTHAAEFNVGVFIPQRSYDLLFKGDKRKKDKPVVIAYAVQGAFGGDMCKALNPSMQDADNKLTKSWYKTSKETGFSKTTAKLYAISETPYAAQYAGVYPRHTPMYGAPQGDEGVFGKGGADSAGAADEAEDAEQ